MTVVTRWNPYRELNSLQNHMNRLFNAQFGGSDESLTTGAFVPPVDVYEDEHGIQLKLEVPGISENDLDIRVENNRLTVSGERRFEQEQKEENFHRVERRYGSFYRAFTVPNTIDPESVKAEYDAGILHLELQKKPESKPKQIKVNVASAKELGQKTSETVKTA